MHAYYALGVLAASPATYWCMQLLGSSLSVDSLLSAVHSPNDMVMWELNLLAIHNGLHGIVLPGQELALLITS